MARDRGLQIAIHRPFVPTLRAQCNGDVQHSPRPYLYASGVRDTDAKQEQHSESTKDRLRQRRLRLFNPMQIRRYQVDRQDSKSKDYVNSRDPLRFALRRLLRLAQHHRLGVKRRGIQPVARHRVAVNLNPLMVFAFRAIVATPYSGVVRSLVAVRQGLRGARTAGARPW